MTSNSTKERIISAAERLFAEGGYNALSMRAVTGAAGVNLAAVNYHFGSKLALAQAILHRFITPLATRQVQLLNQLEGRDTPLTVRDLVVALITPFLEAFEQEGEAGWLQVRMFGRAMTEPSQELWEIMMAEVEEVRTRYVAAFGRVLPQLSPQELWWRYKTISAILIIDQSGLIVVPQPPELTSPAQAESKREWLITFLTAGLEAPPAKF